METALPASHHSETSTSIEGLAIREAGEADAGDILYFIKELASFEGELDRVSATEADLRDSLFRQKAAQVVFAVYEGRKVGFAVYHRTFSTFLGRPGINLVDLYIEPGMRSRGFGEEMIRYLASLVRDGNMGRLEWWVHDWNDKAKAFYTRIGAEKIGDIRVYRLSGEGLRRTAGYEST